MKRWLVCLIAVLLPIIAVSCATTYHRAGPSGGFTETRLSPRSYMVRFQGNGYTSPSRASQFLLRRAAELTLENGYRYFVLQEQVDQSRHDWLTTYPAQSLTMTFAGGPMAGAADAVTVIKETSAIAGGVLSENARAALDRLN